MTLLFLLIAAVAGVVVLLYEKRLREENLRKLQNYLVGVVQDETLPQRQKQQRIVELFTQNGYRIDDMGSTRLLASRREFSVGAALLWFALGGVGLVLYLIYYFVKRPETLEVDLARGTIDAG